MADSTRPAPLVSVIIPALNEASAIDATLDAVTRLTGPVEILLVDGGSHDDTVARAARRNVRMITAARGRGLQMHAGAQAACGAVFWFLHADTCPPGDAIEHIRRALDDPRVVAGNFEIRFSGDSLAARFLTHFYRRLGSIGLRYGDSAYFVRREAYERVGGFRPFPLFEDLDLMRRLKRVGRFTRVPATVVTSSRRFEGRSFAGVFACWTFLQVLYWLGAPPGWLGRVYRHVRSRSASPAPTASQMATP